jgi:site-specific recombinase XerD
MTLLEGLKAYRIFAKAAGHSNRTIQWIETSVHYFSEFMGERQDMEQITANDLRRFIIAWNDRPKYAHHPFAEPGKEHISPMTVQTYARAIRAYFGHMAEEEMIPSNPMARVKMPKVPKKIVPTFTSTEIEHLLRMPDKNTSSGFRDFALIMTFIDTNARLSELLNLDEPDVDIENGLIKVMGKGNKQRLIPFGVRTGRLLLKYKMKYRPEPIGTQAFWLSEAGDRLKSPRVEFLIRQYGKRAGLGRCYPHKLRHSGSVLYLRNGGDPFSLQKMLGHTSLQMTRHYCDLADTDVKAAHKKFGVADRLKI